MTYIDYKNKVVFNGSAPGKEYGAKGVIERMAQRIVKAHGAPKYAKINRLKFSNPRANRKFEYR